MKTTTMPSTAHALLAALLLAASMAAAPSPPSATSRGEAGATQSTPAARLVAEAQAAFDRGEALRRDDPVAAARAFNLAAAGFSAALHEVKGNGSLWFNLGNAYLQAGRLGEAIAAYLEAQRLIPSDPRLAANLSAARALVREPVVASADRSIWSSIVASRNALAPRTRLWLALAASATFWGLLCVRLVRPVPVAAIVAAALLALLLGATVTADLAVARDRDKAVVIAEKVVLHESNGEATRLAAGSTLGPGIEVVVVDERPDWLKVRLPDGAQGWLRNAQVQRIGVAPQLGTIAP